MLEVPSIVFKSSLDIPNLYTIFYNSQSSTPHKHHEYPPKTNDPIFHHSIPNHMRILPRTHLMRNLPRTHLLHPPLPILRQRRRHLSQHRLPVILRLSTVILVCSRLVTSSCPFYCPPLPAPIATLLPPSPFDDPDFAVVRGKGGEDVVDVALGDTLVLHVKAGSVKGLEALRDVVLAAWV